MKLEFFSTDIQKNTQTLHLMKIRQLGNELLDEGGQADMTKIIATFSNLANASKMSDKDGWRNFCVVISHLTVSGCIFCR
jgi:hypothetical protein